MISLKKLLEVNELEPVAEEPKLQSAGREPKVEPDERLPVTLGCYRGTLLAVGESAVHGLPSVGAELEKELKRLEGRLSENPAPESVIETQEQVEVQLRKWGERTANYLKGKTDDVKELLMALAKTAESVGSRDLRYTGRLSNITVHLQQIGNLDSLTQIRSSLVKQVGELKDSVDEMTQESRQLVKQLKSEVATYEARLRHVELLVSRDELTGAANRRSAEERMQANIASGQTFSILMLDMNGFKEINDRHGHNAGDQVLRQFAEKLMTNVRSGDLVSRWGGDEFVVILASDSVGARSQVDRISKAVFGKYTIQDGANESVKVYVDASLGLAQWRPGQSLNQLVAQADALMYEDKRGSRGLARMH